MLPWLAPFVDEPTLTEDELIRLACALGELGGQTAHRLLEKMLSSENINQPAVIQEIEIALSNL